MLSGEDVAKILFTPSGFESPSFDATRGRLLLFQEVERHMSQHHKVLLAVILAHATGVFLKGDVAHPMQTIFDTPVAADRAPEGLSIARQAAEVIAPFSRYLLAGFALCFDHANATQPRPCLFGIEIGDAS